MKSTSKDILNRLELKLNNDWMFHTELHRAHHRHDRETFSFDLVTRDQLNIKHMHVSLFNTNWNYKQYEKVCQKYNYMTQANYRNGYTYKIPGEFELIKGITLMPNKDLKEGLTYNFIKNLLFPINLKKAVTLLNYENNDMFKVLAQIVVLKKINERIFNNV